MTHYRCRKCRYHLFTDECVIAEHGKKDEVCPATHVTTQWFLSTGSENLPQWIYQAINGGFWNKGKLYCPKCQGRIGSFDFTSGNKCHCKQYTLPPVHVLCCRVDQISQVVQQEVVVPRERMPLTEDKDRDGLCQLSPTAGTETTGPDLMEKITTERKHRRLQKRSRMVMHEDTQEEPFAVCRNQFEVLEQEVVEDNKEEEDVKENTQDSVDVKNTFHKSCWELPLFSAVSVDHCCPICLELYCLPTKCQPCCHIFCNSCLRRLARERPWGTLCPMCRKIIVKCVTDKELEVKLTDLYPEEYRKRFHKERKLCSDRFYRLPSYNRPIPGRLRTNLFQFNSTCVILFALLLTIIFCITPLVSLVFITFKVLSYFLDSLIHFLDSAVTVMAVHDIIQMF